MLAAIHLVARRMFACLVSVAMVLQYSYLNAASAQERGLERVPFLQDIPEPSAEFDFEASSFSSIDGVVLAYKTPANYDAINISRSVNGGPLLGGHVKAGEALLEFSVDRSEPLPVSVARARQITIEFKRNDFGQFPRVSDVRLVVSGKTKAGLPTSISIEGSSRQELVLPASLSNNRSSKTKTTLQSLVQANLRRGISVLYSARGEHFGGRSIIRGVVLEDIGSAVSTISIDGRPVPHVDGVFEAILDGFNAKMRSHEVVATFEDGHVQRRVVPISSQTDNSALSEPETRVVELAPGGKSAVAFGAQFELPSEARLPGSFKIRCNRYLETPGIGSDFYYTLNSHCASFGIDPVDEPQPVTIKLPSTTEGFPDSFNRKSARIFSYEVAENTWSLQPDSFIDLDNKKTVGTLNERSSAVVAGILAKPALEDGEPANFSTDSLTAFSKVDPRAGIKDIATPEANNTGSATTTFLFDNRPVRGQSKPEFKLAYNSLGSDGSAGEGWSLEVPAITVDTKWGVPEFDPTNESETYLLNGMELIAMGADKQEFPPAYRSNFRVAGDKYARAKVDHYRVRKEGPFIEAYKRGISTSLDRYFWEVVYPDGRHEFYGGKPAFAGSEKLQSAGLLTGMERDDAAILFSGRGKVAARWGLSYAVDNNKNAIRYQWESDRACETKDSGFAQDDCVAAMRLQSVTYNLQGDSNLIPSQVDADGYWAPTTTWFQWQDRQDRSLDGRSGMLVQAKSRLESVVTTYGGPSGDQKCFSFASLKYAGAASLGKSLLENVSVRMTDAPVATTKVEKCSLEAATTPHVTAFEYFAPEASFSAAANVTSPIEKLSLGFPKTPIADAIITESALGTTTSEEIGGSAYVGISAIPDKKISGGVKFGYTNRKTKGHTSVVDLTGDGIADLVYLKGGQLLVCPGSKRAPDLSYGKCEPAKNAPGMMLDERADNISVGGEFHPWSFLVVGGGFTKSTTNKGTYFADVDGDGRVDIVDDGVPHFNTGYFDNEVHFDLTSGNLFLASGAPEDAAATDELAANYADQQAAAIDKQTKFDAVDVVQAWRSPYKGVVVLSGITLKTYEKVQDSSGQDSSDENKSSGPVLIVERSRFDKTSKAEAVVACFEGSQTDSGALAWNSGSVCKPAKLPNKKAADIDEDDKKLAAELAADKGYLTIQVEKDDVVYFRRQSDENGRFVAAAFNANISFAEIDDEFAKPSEAQLNRFSQWEFIKSVFVASGWKADLLSSCRPGGNTPTDIPALAPRCDWSGHNPYWFDPFASAKMASTPQNDITLRHSGPAELGGRLRFPASTQPVRLTLLTHTIPKQGVDVPIDAQIRANRALVEPADAVSKFADWTAVLEFPIAVDCTDPSNPKQSENTGLPIKCEAGPSADGKHYATLDFQDLDAAKRTFQICAETACADLKDDERPETSLRLELHASEILDTSSDQNLDPLDWRGWSWAVPPSVTFTPQAVNPADLACSGEGCDKTKPQWVDGGMPAGAATQETVFLTPIYRDIWRRQVLARELPGQKARIASEANYLKANETSSRKFDYPVVDEQGYQLPGEGTGCEIVNQRPSCRYRIAHTFTSQDDVIFGGSPDQAFAFRIKLTVNGKSVLLQEVPQPATGTACFGKSPDRFNRLADCVLSFELEKDAPTSAKVATIDYWLNDSNFIDGRDRVFEFRAEPGSILHVEASVRPVFNPKAGIENYVSGLNCAQQARTVSSLIRLPTGACALWKQLDSTSVRLGMQNPLGLGANSYPPNVCGKDTDNDGKPDQPCSRRDVAELFVPLVFAEEHECFGGKLNGACVMPDVKTMSLASPRIAMGLDGWSRFAFKNRSFSFDGTTQPPSSKASAPLATPAYGSVQYPKGEFSAASVASVKTDAETLNQSCKEVGSCESETGNFANKTGSNVRIFSMLPRYVPTEGPVLGDDTLIMDGPLIPEDAKIQNHIATAASTCENADQPRYLREPPGKAETYRSCFKGPDRDIWLEIAGNGLAIDSGRLGPDDLIDNAPKLRLEVGKIAGSQSPRLTIPALTSATDSISASATPLSSTQSSSITKTSFLDMNGDRYPDPVLDATVFLSGPSGVSRKQWIDTQADRFGGAVQESEAKQDGIGVTIPPSATINAVRYIVADGQGNLGHQPDGSTTPGGTGTPDGFYGLALGLDANRGQAKSSSDLIDINGDGLPDRVTLDDKFVTVAYNLGYRFSQPVTRAVPRSPLSQNFSGGLALSVGYNDANNGWSGGLGLSRNGSSSTTTFLDMNGDGLIDIVEPDPKNFKIFFNQGDRFVEGTDAKDLAIDWKFKDTGAAETTLGDAGVSTSPSGPPLCLLSCYLVINPNAKLTRSVGRILVTASDLDGDGLPDFSSTKGFYQGWNGDAPQFGIPGGEDARKVTAYFNPLGKANKLKRVKQPSGALISLDYDHFGNDPDSQSGVWALSRVQVYDGLSPGNDEAPDGQDGSSTTIGYQDLKYDRVERQQLGFGTVTVKTFGCDFATAADAFDGRCGNETLIRVVTRDFDTRSIYGSGNLLKETISSQDLASAGTINYRTTFYSYDLVQVSEPATGSNDSLSTDIVSGACVSKTGACEEEIAAKNEASLLKTRDVWSVGEPRRYYSRLSLVTVQNREENSGPALESAMLYNYDIDGNPVTMIDLGQIDEPGDEYRVDLFYQKMIRPDFHGLTLANFENAATRNLVAELRISAGVKKEEKEEENILRFRRADYDTRGRLAAQCDYRVVSRTLLTTDASANCRAVREAGQDAAKVKALMATLGLDGDDISPYAETYDDFGNVTKIASPLNADAEWIEQTFDYGGFLGMSATDRTEAHCRTESGKSGCTPFATFRSSALTDRRFGLSIQTVDMNNQSINEVYDLWGRPTTVTASWAPLNYAEKHLSPAALADCKALFSTGLPRSVTKTVENDCRVLLHATYDDMPPAYGGNDQRVALLERYVNADLYGGGADTGDSKSVVRSAMVVDPAGKQVQTVTEAAACTENRPLDDLGNLKGVAPRASDLCSKESRFIRSEWREYDGIGRTTKEYFPAPFDATAADMAQAAKHLPAMPALSEADAAADYRYDPVDRPLQISLPGTGEILPDGGSAAVKAKNDLSFAYRIIEADKTKRLRIVARDARCAAKAYERDARGRIRTVYEINANTFDGQAKKQPASRTPVAGEEANGKTYAREVVRCLDASADDISKALASALVEDSQTAYRYDPLDQLRSIDRRIPNRLISARYDLFGQRIQLDDPDRGQQTTQYDPLGNVIRQTTKPFPNAEDDGGDKIINYDYDANRLVGTRYEQPDSEFNISYFYDRYPDENWAGWAKSKAFRDNFKQQFSKGCTGCTGRLVAVQDNSGITVSDFNALGQAVDTLRSVVDQDKEIGRFHLTNDFDSWGVLRQSRVDDLAPATPAAACSGGSEAMPTYLCAFSETQAFRYDQSGKVHQVLLDGQPMALFAYDAFGQITSKWSADGSVTAYSYDPQDRRLTSSQARLLGIGPLASSSYAYDAAGNVLSYATSGGDVEAGDGKLRSYLEGLDLGYDAASRLTSATGIANSISTYQERFTYDALHRMKSRCPGADDTFCKSYTYGEDDNVDGKWRPLTAPAKITLGNPAETAEAKPDWTEEDRTYTRFGNLDSIENFDTSGNPTSARSKLLWDPENRLSEVSTIYSGATKTDREIYIYDHLGNRAIKRDRDHAVTMYVSPTFSRRYGGPAHVHVMAGETRLASRSISVPASGEETETFFYHSILPNGSVNTVTREIPDLAFQAELYQRISYGPYGDQLFSCTVKVAGGPCIDGKTSGGGEAHVAGDEPPITQDRSLAPFFAYSGKERDSTGFAYFGARYYDADIGQWLSPDPILGKYLGGSPNAGIFGPINLASYSYASNSPISTLDVAGAFSLRQGLGAARGIGGGFEVAAGVTLAIAASWTGAGAIAGGAVALHGADQVIAGWRTAVSDENIDSGTSQALQSMGMSRTGANVVDLSISFVGTVGAGTASRLLSNAELSLQSAGSLQGLRSAAQEAAGVPTPTAITEYSSHALKQIAGRDGGLGVAKSAVMEAFDNPTAIEYVPHQIGPTFRYIGRDAVTVVNQYGKVITAWARNSSGIK